jgi:hypothetical protein
MLVRQTTATNFIDVLDHVVDKGIVIDAWAALWGVGINLVKSGCPHQDRVDRDVPLARPLARSADLQVGSTVGSAVRPYVTWDARRSC